jgi:hypothetical protein
MKVAARKLDLLSENMSRCKCLLPVSFKVPNKGNCVFDKCTSGCTVIDHLMADVGNSIYRYTVLLNS